MTPDQDDEARCFAERTAVQGLRVRVDHKGSVGTRIRKARLRRDHLIGVIGPKERERETVRITDVASHIRQDVDRAQLEAVTADAYAERRPLVDWSST